jgi:D-alanyl-lipoteichoic acid acyltransferase DltB (MBOAT superfamily)
MLFNSYPFIFGFLPISLLCFELLGRLSHDWARRWLILVSLFFYTWWRPINVLLIAPSIMINYGLARALQRFGSDRPAAAKCALLAGIAFNLLFLGYFKYLDFARTTLNDVLGTNLVLTHLILPLGISFITFQKIAFLVDVHAGRVKSFSFQEYALFVLFFPQLTAGPIVHYREMMPQFQAASYRLTAENVGVGITLFSFGLFKKVVLADSIAPFVTPIYDAASAGGAVSLFYAWIAAIGFGLQIYFDFSGYTDMALGLARFFGIKLPLNFNSPLKATSVIEFWQRWHASLTRFLTAYIYNPLLLAITRRRVDRNLPLISPRNTTLGAFLSLLVVPTVLTMFLSGLWHGAGYQFIIFGLLHGTYLCINHAWRIVRPKFWRDTASYQRSMQPVGWLLTYLGVTVCMVFFRASSVSAALTILQGMIGWHGVALPAAVLARLGSMGQELRAMGVTAGSSGGHDFLLMSAWTAALFFIAMVPPNSLQMLSRYEPALGVRPRPDQPPGVFARIAWRPSLGWAVGMSVVSALAILSLGQLSTFLYWQF